MIALSGGCLCDPAQGLWGPADIYIRAGRILAVVPSGSPAPDGAWQVYDCTGRLVVPGPIDTLCRLSPAAEPWREDADTLAAAASSAGYTSLLVYTGSADPDIISGLARVRRPVRLLPVAALSAGDGLCDLGRLAAAGAVAYSDWPEPTSDPLRLRRGLAYAGALGRPVVVHPEDASLAQGGVMHEGSRSFAMGLRGVPGVAEVVAVARDAALQRAFGGRLHFAAVSAAESLPFLGDASASVMAHHLVLTEAAVAGYDTAAKLSPPLRTEADPAALLQAARSGRLLVASGHRPTPPEEKACEYDYAAFGASALETALAVALESLGPEAFVHATSLGPARAFGLDGGTLPPGAPADIAVLDADALWTVRPEAFLSRGRTSPLAGRSVRGRAVLTIVGGEVASGDLDCCIKMH